MKFPLQKICVVLTYAQHTPFGSCLGHLYYSNKALLELAPGRNGYPHHGGSHALDINGTREDCRAFIELFATHYGHKVKRECDHLLSALDEAPQDLTVIRLYNHMHEYTVDLSCGHHAAPDHDRFFASNVLHMFDGRRQWAKELWELAPNILGCPNVYGSLLLRGTEREITRWLDAFDAFYYKDQTPYVTARIREEMDRRINPKRIIRCYRILHPEKYAAPEPHGEVFAKVHQVRNEKERSHGIASYASARDSFILYCAWEVGSVTFNTNTVDLRYVNGFEASIDYATFYQLKPGEHFDRITMLMAADEYAEEARDIIQTMTRYARIQPMTKEQAARIENGEE